MRRSGVDERSADARSVCAAPEDEPITDEAELTRTLAAFLDDRLNWLCGLLALLDGTSH